jgi:hypothetical protein
MNFNDEGYSFYCLCCEGLREYDFSDGMTIKEKIDEIAQTIKGHNLKEKGSN